MNPVECEFEAEVLAAALQSRWPERVDDELRAHVAGCAICSDVIAIARALDDAREEMRASASVPDSSRVWWLAQLRARREAVLRGDRRLAWCDYRRSGDCIRMRGGPARCVFRRHIDVVSVGAREDHVERGPLRDECIPSFRNGAPG